MEISIRGGPADGLDRRPASASDFAAIDFQQMPDGQRWLVVRLKGSYVQHLYRAWRTPFGWRYVFLESCRAASN